MGRPRKPDSERRTKVFYLRLLPREMEELSRAARERKMTIAGILRSGADLYLRSTPAPSTEETEAGPLPEPAGGQDPGNK